MHTYETLFAQLEANSRLPPIDVGERIVVDTSVEPNIDDLVRDIERAFERRANG